MGIVAEQTITAEYAIYLGDCIEVLGRLPERMCHLSIYSPPFAGLYHYSSSDRDLSNNQGLDQFMAHYRFVVQGLTRVTMPGRMSAVHCADVPTGNSGRDALTDFPGEIVRLYQSKGWAFIARYAVWKEPFRVRMRTLAKGLAHRTIVDDASRCSNAGADYLLIFRAPGESPVEIKHPQGFTSYAGAREVPADIRGYQGHIGSHLENRYSHWVWRQYASAFWDDVRVDRVLPYQQAKDEEDEKHVHPLQLDVIERLVTLWSNPGEVVISPFAGVGSEVYGAVQLGRKAIGIELKPAYYRQMVRNMDIAIETQEQIDLLGSGLALNAETLNMDDADEAYDATHRGAASRSGRWLGKSK